MILFEISREAFLPFLVFSFLCGIAFGAVYDIFRIRRKAVRAAKRRILDLILTFFEDVIFCLFVTVTMILVCYKLYFGIPRWYSYAAAVIGFFLWQKTVGCLVMKVSDKIIEAIVRAGAFVKNKCVSPIIGGIKRLCSKYTSSLSQKRAKKYTEKREKAILALLQK